MHPEIQKKCGRDSKKQYYLNISNIVHTSLSFVFVVEHSRVDFVSLCHVYIDHSKNCVKKLLYAHAWHSTAHHICKQMNENKSHNLLLLLLTIYCLWSSTHKHSHFELKCSFRLSLSLFRIYIILLHLQKDHCRIMDKWHTCVRSVMQTSLWMSRKQNQDEKKIRTTREAEGARDKCAKWKNV